MNTADKLAVVESILRSAGVSRAWRFADGLPGELVVLIDRKDFDRTNVEIVEREIVAAVSWKVWLTYRRETSAAVVEMF